MGRARLQWIEAFFLSLNSHSLFQDLTLLRGGLKTASGKENLSSSYKRCSDWGTPWCHPKAGNATSWHALSLQRWLSLRLLQPCPQQTGNQIS
jgi:hypothetical protein